METKNINVFNQISRKICCINNSFDYLGDGNIFTEEELEIGKIYTFKSANIESYGSMVFIEEIDSKYGFHDFLFEELEAYDDEVLKEKYNHLLSEKLGQSLIDADEGRVKPAKEVFDKILNRIKQI